MKISVIIPVFNEKCRLPGLVKKLEKIIESGHEIIIVDGGSVDMSTESLSAPGVIVISSRKGRARQMNAGAHQASGEVLWFLHADSDFLCALDIYLQVLCQVNEMQWGRFNVRLSGRSAIYRVIEYMMNLRSSLTGISTGDQGLFVHKKLFTEVGGFADIAIMEDVDLSKKLKKKARPVVEKICLLTSSRRWEERGVLKTVFLMWKMRFLFFLGADPAKLAKYYE